MTDAVGLIVLCGGGARRMGGVDKPLEKLAGQPLAGWVLERLAPHVDDVVISANRHRSRYRRLWPKAKVVADAIPDAGPLAGVAAGCAALSTPLVLLCPGDAPLVSPAYLPEMLAVLGSADAVVPHDGERLQPLFALLRRSAADDLTLRLEQGLRRVDEWLADLDVIRIDASTNPAAFVNVNRTEELQELEMQLTRGIR